MTFFKREHPDASIDDSSLARELGIGSALPAEDRQLEELDGDLREIEQLRQRVRSRADNLRGPGGPMGPLCNPLKTSGTLSRPSITH